MMKVGGGAVVNISSALSHMVEVGFVAYGTPCGEDCDPGRARLNELEEEIAELRKEVAALKAARQPAPKVKSA